MRKFTITVVGFGIYTPINNDELRAIVVDERALIKEADRLVRKGDAWLRMALREMGRSTISG